jgi:hypothetical protein
MDKQRRVHKVLSVFDILNYRSVVMPGTSSIRVQFEYDAEAKKEDFTILSRNIPEETRELLKAMLRENVSSEKIIYGLESNNLDYGEIINNRITAN